MYKGKKGHVAHIFFLFHGLGYPFIRGCAVYSLQRIPTTTTTVPTVCAYLSPCRPRDGGGDAPHKALMPLLRALIGQEAAEQQEHERRAQKPEPARDGGHIMGGGAHGGRTAP